MKPRYFFFGLYRVPMWEYMCGMTIAQIELLSVDKPLVLYGKKKEFEDHDAQEIEQLKRKYESEHKDDKGIVNGKDLIKGFKIN